MSTLPARPQGGLPRVGRTEPKGASARWTTPGLLRGLRLASLLLLSMELIVVVDAVRANRTALRDVEQRAAPSLRSVERMEVALAGMDADTARLLGQPLSHEASLLDDRESKRTEAARSLLATAETDTLGEGERASLEELESNLGSYERLVQRAQDVRDRGDSAAVGLYRQAASLMDERILPAARNLDAAHRRELGRALQQGRLGSATGRGLLVFVVLLEMAVLGGAQLFLSRRMHRTVNPALLLATVLTAVLAGHFLGSLTRSQEDLALAGDAMVHGLDPLWQARTLAQRAQGQMERSLLDPGRLSEYKEAYDAETHAVATLPQNLTTEQLAGALREGDAVDGFHGILAEVEAHTTRGSEREALATAVAAWADYLAASGTPGQPGTPGPRTRTASLTSPGRGEQEQAAFDRALTAAASQREQDFSEDTRWTLEELRHAVLLAALFDVAVAALVFAGFAPRIREYL